ncbi:class I SAM-dependent methyltransferase [Candidatus Methylopumilus planktonicus]|uniref:class I SAM-dependent methyltransferase n=1 Tax=Candidatus Methylopumilus planktonicus TaxID=1581557 RepID=UPI003BEF4279
MKKNISPSVHSNKPNRNKLLEIEAREHNNYSARIKIIKTSILNNLIMINLAIENVGTIDWNNKNIKIGAKLFSMNKLPLVSLNEYRFDFKKITKKNDTYKDTIQIQFDNLENGKYRLEVDLVFEHKFWFAQPLASAPWFANPYSSASFLQLIKNNNQFDIKCLSKKNIDKEDFVDVKKLMKTLTEKELLSSANEYWSQITLDSDQCYKPFGNVSTATYLTRNLSLLFEAANFFHGADVLDFGCASGWLTIALAEMGMNATGVDISPKAIDLANSNKKNIRPSSTSLINFEVYKGHKLPFKNNSFDRIVCFDVFHHVRSQKDTLKEMSRVLRPGGRIAMLEPGPGHSKAPWSQMEMRLYRVIENDIKISEIAKFSKLAGLKLPIMIMQLETPLVIPYKSYLNWIQKIKAIMGFMEKWSVTQCFFIEK